MTERPMFEENSDGTFSGPFGTTWLPEDDTHPIRPDLPWLRHFTFREGHGVELGLWLGLASGFFLSQGETAVALAVFGFTRRGLAGSSSMPKEIRQLFRDAWYILVAMVVATPVGYLAGAVV